MKILIVGSNSILSKAIINQHLEDDIETIYHLKPSAEPVIQHKLSNLDSLGDEFNLIYIISAIISINPEDSKSLFDINVTLVQQLSGRFKKAKLIYFSTVAVYDNLNDVMINEHTQPSPHSVYGISKLWAETLIRQHAKYCILRISSMYGIGMKNNTFLPRVIDDAITKKEITLFGDGKRTQNYIHVNDIAFLAKKLAMSDKNCTQLAISSINHSNIEIAEIIRNFTDCEIKYINKDNSRSVEYFQNSLPYAEYNSMALENGIEELIKWKKNQF